MAGIKTLEAGLPLLIAREKALFVTVNGENAADGYGLTQELADRIFACGADVITSGNHIWEKRDFWLYMESQPRMLRPANYPQPAAGNGSARIEKDGLCFLVINLQGREYMKPIDCPFRCFDRIFDAETSFKNAGLQEGAGGKPRRPLVLVDFHAESVKEKEAFGFYADGRASVVAGTHTHVQTADEKLLPLGCAYITDLGMTGSRAGVIGMKKEICIKRALSHIQVRMECAEEDCAIQGIAVKIDVETARALEIKRIEL